MKIYLNDNIKDKELVKKMLVEEDIEFTEDKKSSLFYLVPSDEAKSFLGYLDKEIFIIDPNDVIYVESYEKDVICHTNNTSYSLNNRLYEIEAFYYEFGFLRVNNSYVVNTNHITKITPQLNRKFKLLLTNNTRLFVTRSYYLIFKKYIGL